MQFSPSSLLEGLFVSKQIPTELIYYSAIFSGLTAIEGLVDKLMVGDPTQSKGMRDYPFTDPLRSRGWIQDIANDPKSFNYAYLCCRAASSCNTKSAVDQFKSHLKDRNLRVAYRIGAACRSMNRSFYTWSREIATKHHKTELPGGTHVFPIFSKLSLEEIKETDQITQDKECSVLTVGFNQDQSELICADHWQGRVDEEFKAPPSERFSFRDVKAVAEKPKTAEFIDLFECCDDEQKQKLKLALPQSLSDFVSYLDNKNIKHIDGRERLAGNPNGKVQNCQTEIEEFLRLWAKRAKVEYIEVFGKICPPINMLGLGFFSDKKASPPPSLVKTILYTLVELTRHEVVAILGVGLRLGVGVFSDENDQKSGIALQVMFFLLTSVFVTLRLLSIHVVVKALKNHLHFVSSYRVAHPEKLE